MSKLIDITANLFAKRFDFEVGKRPCPQCGVILRTEVPFETESFVGLKSKDHACGKEFVLKRFVRKTKHGREAMRKLFGALAGEGENK